MSVRLMHISGLGGNPENPDDDLCGARQMVLAKASVYGDTSPLFYAWDDAGNAYAMLASLLKGGDTVLLSGHSHGAWRARNFIGQLKSDGVSMAKLALALIDECPWGNPFECLGEPEPFPVGPAAGYACWQHQPGAECLFMPKGVKFLAGGADAVDDCTDWTSPKLGHVDWSGGYASIAGDARVWSRIAGVYSGLVALVYPESQVLPESAEAAAAT